jgi:hypothetical protein
MMWMGEMEKGAGNEDARNANALFEGEGGQPNISVLEGGETKHGEEGAQIAGARRQPRSRAPAHVIPLACEHPKLAPKSPGPSPEARLPKLQSGHPHWLSSFLAKKPASRGSSEKWEYIGPRLMSPTDSYIGTPTGSGIQSNFRHGRCKGISLPVMKRTSARNLPKQLQFPSAPDVRIHRGLNILGIRNEEVIIPRRKISLKRVISLIFTFMH